MELVIESIGMSGFSKICNAFQNQIIGFYADNKTDTVDVFLGDSSLWKIGTHSRGVYLTNQKNNVTVTLASREFKKIVIQ